MQYSGFILFLGYIVCHIEHCFSHGYLADPPARSSAWLFDHDFRACCTYYEHNEMFCGGTYHQWIVNGGKCSICGEAYNIKNKLFDKGGAKYLGKIVRTYIQGSVIPVTVVLTANHLGLFEFRVCSVDNDPTKDATQSCLNLNILNTVNGLSQYHITSSLSTVNLQLRLPQQLVCKHCVFQWKYQTGNSWGISNGRGCLGCGKENEEFYGCADIAIVKQDESILNVTTTTTTTTTTNTAILTKKETSIEPSKCTSIVTFSQSFDISDIMEQYCQTICSKNCAFEKKINNATLHDNCVDSCSKLCACQ